MAASVIIPSLGEHEAAFRVTSGATIVVRITASQLPNDPTHVVLLVETEQADPESGMRGDVLRVHTATIPGTLFLGALGTEIALATEIDRAIAHAEAVFGVRAALAGIPAAARPAP